MGYDSNLIALSEPFREAFFSDSEVKDEGRWAVSVLSALGRSKTWMSERKKALNVSPSMRDWDVSGFHCSWAFFLGATNERPCLCGNLFRITVERFRSLGPLCIPLCCPTKANHSNYTKTETESELLSRAKLIYLRTDHSLRDPIQS